MNHPANTQHRPSYVAPTQARLRADAQRNARADIGGTSPARRGNVIAATWDSLGKFGKLAVAASTLVGAAVAGSNLAPSGDGGAPKPPTPVVRHLGYLDYAKHVQLDKPVKFGGPTAEQLAQQVNHNSLSGQALLDVENYVDEHGSYVDPEGHHHLGDGDQPEIPELGPGDVAMINNLDKINPNAEPNLGMNDQHQ